MARHHSVIISGAVEGPTDEAAVRRLISHVGATPGTMYGKKGKPHLQQNIRRYNEAARYRPWVVVVDLDHDADCAPSLRAEWLPSIAPTLCFRIAVRAIETWFLADRQRMAHFLSIPMSNIPHEPEAVDDPKTLLVNLARRSRRRAIREDIVPRPESGRSVGPAYTSRLIEFAESRTIGWRPEVAATSSYSLRRCLSCLERLVNRSNST
jgi:hypothetical protein